MIYNFANKEDLFDFIKKDPNNIHKLIKEKTLQDKRADAVTYCPSPEIEKREGIKEAGLVDKADTTLVEGQIMVRAIINTTNNLDSHGDVHIPGLWKKSIAENKYILHLQEHQRTHDHVISEDVKAYTKNMAWSSIGSNYEGNTQALIFDSKIEQKRNPFMYEQYLNGWVKQHSVGMRYVKVYFCADLKDEWAINYKENWDKYIDTVANKEDAINNGYFYAVTEAKVIEGSSVVFGSNAETPTLSVSTPKEETNEEIKEEAEQITSTEIATEEPTVVTPESAKTDETEIIEEDKSKVNYSELAKSLINLKNN